MNTCDDPKFTRNIKNERHPDPTLLYTREGEKSRPTFFFFFFLHVDSVKEEMDI